MKLCESHPRSVEYVRQNAVQQIACTLHVHCTIANDGSFQYTRSAMIHPFGNANIKKACYCTPHFFIGLNLVEFPLKLIIMKNARKIAIERARINICSMLLQG